MAGQQRFWCPKSYNSVYLRKEMYGSKPNGYRTVGTFRTAFTFTYRKLKNQTIPLSTPYAT